MKSNRILIIALVVISIALIISLVFNYVIFSFSRQYYLQLNGTRLDPLGLSAYPSDKNEEVTNPKPSVVFFGDSRAYQWPEPPGLNQFQFVNRGIGAQTSPQVVERYDDHIKPLKPDILLIQVCINDLKTIPLFPHLKSSIIRTCQENIKWIVLEAQKEEAIVILTTIFPLGKLPFERRFFWSDDVGEAIEDVNEYIYTLQDERVIIFDSAAILADEEGIVREEYSWDFLHLNEAGYKALNEELIVLLKELEETVMVTIP